MLVAGLVLVSACNGGSDDPGTTDPTAQDTATDNLVNGSPWNLTSASGPNGDVTADYAGTTITFTETGYTVSGLPAEENPWTGAANGNWSLSSSDTNVANSITRADGVEVSVNVSASNLTLQFTIAAAGGRTQGIEGDWTFRFSAAI